MTPVPRRLSPPAPPVPPGRGPSRRDLLRWGAAAGGSIALGALLAGCSPQSTAAVRSGRADLSFWTHDPGYEKFFTEALPVADRKSDFDFALDITTIAAADIPTKLIAQAVAGTGTPDVAGLEIGAFCRMLRGDIAAELLSDLSPSVASRKDDLIAARLTPFSKDGHLYALDSDTPLCVYYHRADQFEALGIPDDLTTWEEYMDVGAKLNKSKGVSLHAVAVTDPGGTLQSYQILLLQRGGDLYDEDGGIDIQTPEAERTLQFLVDGVQSGAIATVADMYGPSLQSGLKGARSWPSTCPPGTPATASSRTCPSRRASGRCGTCPGSRVVAARRASAAVPGSRCSATSRSRRPGSIWCSPRTSIRTSR